MPDEKLESGARAVLTRAGGSFLARGSRDGVRVRSSVDASSSVSQALVWSDFGVIMTWTGVVQIITWVRDRDMVDLSLVARDVHTKSVLFESEASATGATGHSR